MIADSLSALETHGLERRPEVTEEDAVGLDTLGAALTVSPVTARRLVALGVVAAVGRAVKPVPGAIALGAAYVRAVLEVRSAWLRGLVRARAVPLSP
jgi:hypothetical protein